jgi:glycine cleavage system H protein
MTPRKLKYLETHEWADMDADNIVTIGLSAFAIEQLGDIVYIELPKIGETFKKGDSFGVIESVKAASDMYTPISGTVVEVNDRLPDELYVLKTDTFTKGWMIKIKADSPEQFDSLMTAEDYDRFIETQQD